MDKRLLLLFLTLLCFSIGLFGQDFYDANTINEIRLYFTQANWDQLLDNLFAAGNEDRLLGTAVINGVTYDSVGVRYKGNSSYNPTRLKNPFNIKLDYIIEDQLIDDKYGTIKLANGFSDPSFVRETLSYEIARKYMPASKANYAKVYVNDVLIGAYTSVQDVDSYFMREHFHCSGKPRFKCDTNSFDAINVWGYLGADSTAYMQYYGLESNYGWNALVNFTNVLTNNQNNIASVMNVDQDLWMVAFDNLLVNLDSPINVFHNFYLFGDADNRINPLLWDLNMSFGGFTQGVTLTQMQNYDPLKNINSTRFFLISHVLSNARYKKMYIAHMRTMLQENISNNWYSTRATELQTICGPIVQADPNFFYTYANFQANINSSVTGGAGGPGIGTICGITQLMSARANYLLNSSAFQGTVPTINSLEHNPQVLYQGSNVTFLMNAANATYAQLGIRQNIAEKFTYYQMFDDGAHNDGAAGDGIFGVSVTLGFGDIQYFGWAENATQGAFLPARAEHEFFESSVFVQPGELLINEIQAKNASYTDPNGEFDDWVEIYNPNDYPVDLGGMYMTDSHYSNGISAWTQIPTNAPTQTTVPPHGYLIVWFDEDLDQGPLHINDKLGGGADAVYLIDADGTTIIDYYIWTEAAGLNVDDVSIGRLPNGGTTWQLFGTGQSNPCTPGASNQGTVNSAPGITSIQYSPNPTTVSSPVTITTQVNDIDNNLSTVELLWGHTAVNQYSVNMTLQGGVYTAQIGPFALDTEIRYCIKASDAFSATTYSQTYFITIGYQAPTLYINELMVSNTTIITDEHGNYEDWVEIYNPNPFAVNLDGYYLTDNHHDDINYVILPISSAYPDSTTIPAGGFKLFWFDEQPEQGVLHINNKLGTSADAVYLIAKDMLTVIDNVSWTSATGLGIDLSYGRYPDATNTWSLFGGDNPNPITPGTYNYPTNNPVDNQTVLPPVLHLFPNPVVDNLTIEVKNSKVVSKVKVYNLKGQLVSDFSINPGAKTVWNRKDREGKELGTGMYIIKAYSGKNTMIKKLCIIK